MTRLSVIIATSLFAVSTGWAQTSTAPAAPGMGTPDMSQPRAAREAPTNQAPAEALANQPVDQAPVDAPPANLTEVQGQSGEGKCPAADTVAQPATVPQPGSDSTEANNTGTSGWSGGLGGSQLGTNTQGAIPSSSTWQPPTARGLDLAGRADPVPAEPAAC